MMWKNGYLFSSVPLPKVEGRPLIVSHPAADLNYINSWSIMVENDQPFILFCDDLGPTSAPVLLAIIARVVGTHVGPI